MHQYVKYLIERLSFSDFIGTFAYLSKGNQISFFEIILKENNNTV